ncbi:hypothetical protein [Stenomitos frigidus]|uniref:Uncharacterized protein n=1 Tax=Stenomitos frigidus ULC18 TaxID=2107698 RepID=A0A2T1ELT7_9CYAN|nr:hypothetical protein [Stenomitos frigidus]PSB33696.1 hypothetical protein C7B82_04220 [Stenomitos frigidus ULC18]
MLDVAKIEQLAQDCSPQDLCAALVWQQRFHTFDGPAIIRDLQQQRQLWSSFCFAAANEGAAQDTWGLQGIIETLLAMATERATPATRGTRCAPYPANALYVLAAKQDTVVAPLLALGEQWRADEVFIHDAADHTATCPCGVYLRAALQDAALDERGEGWQEAVIVSYWWQHDTLLQRVASNANLTAGVGFAVNASSPGSGKRVKRGGAHKDATPL